MSRLRLNGMVVDVFETDHTPVGTAVFCHGFPGGIGPLPGVVFLLQNGFNVIFPQYPGSYDSDGIYSPHSAVAAIAELLTVAGQGEQSLPMPSLLVGHSYGALVGCHALRIADYSTINKALLLAPVLSYQSSPDVGTREDLLDHVEGVRKSRPYTYRLADSSEWAALATGTPPVSDQPSNWKGTVLSIVGDADDTFDIAVLKQVHASLIHEILRAPHSTLRVIPNAGHGMDELLIDRQPIVNFLIDGSVPT